MKTGKKWTLLPGTYANGNARKLVPVNKNDPDYILVRGAEDMDERALALLDSLNNHKD